MKATRSCSAMKGDAFVTEWRKNGLKGRLSGQADNQNTNYRK